MATRTKGSIKVLGSSHHTIDEREINDYYATDPAAVHWLMEIERVGNDIWEPCCGEGHISKVIEEYGHSVKSTDLIERGYGQGGVDFFSENIKNWHGDIVTNPPYSQAVRFIEKAMNVLQPNRKCFLFLKLLFLESQEREHLFSKYPPKTVWISRSRLHCAKNGDFKKNTNKAVAYCWYVWVKGFHGEPTIKWFN